MSWSVHNASIIKQCHQSSASHLFQQRCFLTIGLIPFSTASTREPPLFATFIASLLAVSPNDHVEMTRGVSAFTSDVLLAIDDLTHWLELTIAAPFTIRPLLEYFIK